MSNNDNDSWLPEQAQGWLPTQETKVLVGLRDRITAGWYEQYTVMRPVSGRAGAVVETVPFVVTWNGNGAWSPQHNLRDLTIVQPDGTTVPLAPEIGNCRIPPSSCCSCSGGPFEAVRIGVPQEVLDEHGRRFTEALCVARPDLASALFGSIGIGGTPKQPDEHTLEATANKMAARLRDIVRSFDQTKPPHCRCAEYVPAGSTILTARCDNCGSGWLDVFQLGYVLALLRERANV